MVVMALLGMTEMCIGGDGGVVFSVVMVSVVWYVTLVDVIVVLSFMRWWGC